MPLLNYKKQFAPLVESGEKRQTIRAWRKRPFVKGDRLYHYQGLRTRSCRKLLENTCAGESPIYINELEDVAVGGRGLLCAAEKAELARADGFRGQDPWAAMFEFFKSEHGLPFSGQLVQW